MKQDRRLRATFGDPILASAVLIMSAIGVAMVYSAGQLNIVSSFVADLWRMQLAWLALAAFACWIVTRLPVAWLDTLALPAYLTGVTLLLLTLFVGGGAGTAASMKGWISIGGMVVQPAQFANVATILMLARVLSGWKEAPRTVWVLWKPIAITAIPMMLVLAQPDLGTAMVFGGVLLAAIVWAGTPWGILFMLFAPVAAFAIAFMSTLAYSVFMVATCIFLLLYRARTSEWVAVLGLSIMMGAVGWPVWNKLEPYQQARIISFADPTHDPRGAGYQVLQSRIAIGSGGLWGQGYLNGSQKGLRFLPEQHTDFIYAVIGEELGFVGASAVLLFFFVMLMQLIRIAERSRDAFGSIAVFGIFGAWTTHVLVNVGMTVGVMPVTGIPLPFLSYGGSFLVASFIAVGVAQRVEMESART
jgi:rod shape determining protein RodA